ncbi:PREDICTED: ly-6/neurotoxin-like protein 1 [Condylura cristata]|uniref:ly-6/neurotoxin-like protein 1 n=1 Tax=Condylura cristata TaxID=143302 RepID=UPI000642979D|nr:PREDICTED: ly-6/neurotoxin-like protein 1 [Condylura cristata]
MKAAVLLLALLCQEGAQALQCHICQKTSATYGDSCYGAAQCPGGAQACTSVKEYGRTATKQYSFVTKNCINNCSGGLQPHVKTVATGFSFQLDVHCCTTDLCNGAGRLGPGAASVGLLLLPSVLLVLLGAFL